MLLGATHDLQTLSINMSIIAAFILICVPILVHANEIRGKVDEDYLFENGGLFDQSFRISLQYHKSCWRLKIDSVLKHVSLRNTGISFMIRLNNLTLLKQISNESIFQIKSANPK